MKVFEKNSKMFADILAEVFVLEDIEDVKGDVERYSELMQEISDGLFIECGWMNATMLSNSSSVGVGMSTLGLCKPYIRSEYYAGSRNLLPLARRGKRDLGIVLKYSKKQLMINRKELNALLRRVGEL